MMRNVLSQTGSLVRRTTAAACRSLCLRLALGLMLVPAVAHAQPFSIDWHTIDGGGTGSSDDGQPGGFELAGTIGQHDAGSMAGSEFEVSGGFWQSSESVAPGACCFDGVCEDGIAPGFCTTFICDVAAYLPETFQGCYGDANGDGVVTAGDRGFVSANIGTIDAEMLCLFDMDGNGFVTPADRGFISANLGQCADLPDYQNGSGQNAGAPDTRFATATFLGPGTLCSEDPCP